MFIIWVYNYSNELRHFGVLGMKWGVRRYQNKDGSLTPKGRARYKKDAERLERSIKREKGDIAYLEETWRDEGYSSEDIRLGLEGYRNGLKRMERNLQNIKSALANNAPVTNVKVQKLQKKIESSREEGKAFAQRKKAAVQKKIDSLAPFLETGIRDKSGRLMLSPEDVAKSMETLQKLKDNI